MSGPVRIGTRGSELALFQARMVERALSEQGVACELVTIRTTGDKRNAEPFTALGARGIFTRELDAALARGKVDCCVHSLKDLPTTEDEDLVIAAVLRREDPRDALAIHSVTDASNLAELPAGSRVGTSSVRRRALLGDARPDLEAVELRGNVPTRLKKLDSGAVHCAILAAAGLIRLAARQRITSFLEPPHWLPAPGQGAVAVKTRSDDTRVRDLVAPLNDDATATDVGAERALLAALEGGCQVPIGALVIRDELHGFVADLAGRHIVRGSVPMRRGDPAGTGAALAEDLRARGGASILASLRAEQRVPAPQPE